MKPSYISDPIPGSTSSGAATEQAARGTLHARLDDIASTLRQCHGTLVDIGTILTGPTPTGESAKQPPAQGIAQMTGEIDSLARTLRDGLSAVRLFLA